MGEWDPRYPVDLRGAQGVLIGDYGHQTNVFLTGPAGSADAYELKVAGRGGPASVPADAPPSMLLAAHIVPFTGRGQELRTLATWRDSPARIAALLVHGAGGQGKTRLAARFGARSPGWRVIRARHASELGRPPRASASERLSKARPLLVVADYADRWPVQDLLALADDPRLRGQTPVRLLLTARSAGSWWEVTRTRLERLGVPAEDLLLAPLATPAERAAAFRAAAGCFARRLGAADARAVDPPDDLDHERWGHVLTLHMAALVAVDSRREKQAPPGDPAALSGYLLRREADHWQHMHDNHRITTPPPVLARVVFTATLTRPLSYDDALAVLGEVGVATTGETAGPLLDDHTRCYPPAVPGTVFEPLLPDRLGEDYLALTIPGHAASGYRADPAVAGWAATVPARLFARAGAGGEPPAWTRAALTVLVETARRWPHAASQVLYPLLREQPGLALAGGGSVLAALAELPVPGQAVLPEDDLALLEAIEARFPPGRHADLDPGLAAITRRLTAHRLATTTDPLRQAGLNHVLAWRLANAGLREDALAAMSAAVTILRNLPEPKPPAAGLLLARALEGLGACLVHVNRDADALAAEEQAIALVSPRLPGSDQLAGLLSNRSRMLARLGRTTEAAESAYEALRILRRLSAADPEKYLPALADALTCYAAQVAPPGVPLSRWEAELPTTENEGMTRRERGLAHGMAPVHRRVTAKEAAKEAMGIYQRLASADPGEFEASYAGSIANYAIMSWPLGKRDEVLELLVRSVGMFRELARHNPDAYQPGLAHALLILARVRSRGGTVPRDDALRGIARRTMPGPYQMRIGNDDLVIRPFEPTTDPAELAAARVVADEAVMIYARLADRFPAVFTADLDSAREIRAGMAD